MLELNEFIWRGQSHGNHQIISSFMSPHQSSSIISNQGNSVHFLDSTVASIPACHAGDPGSIPGRGGDVLFPGGHKFLGGDSGNRFWVEQKLQKGFDIELLCDFHLGELGRCQQP